MFLQIQYSAKILPIGGGGGGDIFCMLYLWNIKKGSNIEPCTWDTGLPA